MIHFMMLFRYVICILLTTASLYFAINVCYEFIPFIIKFEYIMCKERALMSLENFLDFLMNHIW